MEPTHSMFLARAAIQICSVCVLCVLCLLTKTRHFLNSASCHTAGPYSSQSLYPCRFSMLMKTTATEAEILKKVLRKIKWMTMVVEENSGFKILDSTFNSTM